MDQKRKMVEFLSALPEETTREFELEITKKANDKLFLAEFSDIYTVLGSVLDDAAQSDDTRFAAFYMLNILYRHKKKYDALRGLFESYREAFRGHGSFHHLNALYMFEADFQNNYRDVLNQLFKRSQEYPENAGYVHMFAFAAEAAIEQSSGETQQKIKSEWYESAVSAANHAIRLDSSYAKYYYTLARLQLINKDFSEATKSIDRAIGFEDSDKENYIIKVSDYQYFRMQILIQEQKEQISAQAEQARQQLQDNQKALEKEVGENVEKIKGSLINNVEMVGFFAGIVSFTIGSIQIASSYAFAEAARLILVLLGGLLGVYSGFGFIFSDKASLKHARYLLCFGVGVLIVVGVLIFGRV